MSRKDRQLLVLHEDLDELKTSERKRKDVLPALFEDTRWRGAKDCPKRQVGKSFRPGSLLSDVQYCSFSDYMMPFGSPRWDTPSSTQGPAVMREQNRAIVGRGVWHIFNLCLNMNFVSHRVVVYKFYTLDT